MWFILDKITSQALDIGFKDHQRAVNFVRDRLRNHPSYKIVGGSDGPFGLEFKDEFVRGKWNWRWELMRKYHAMLKILDEEKENFSIVESGDIFEKRLELGHIPSMGITILKPK